MPNVQRWYEALVAAGADAPWKELPARGIARNSHALMADDNSDLVASVVHDWMREKKLVD